MTAEVEAASSDGAEPRDGGQGEPEAGGGEARVPARVAPAWSRWGGPTVVAAVLGGGELVWFAVELLRGYFWQDDFALLYLGRTVPLGELLLQGYNGHLQPGAFLLSWLVSSPAPLSWPAAVLPLVLMHGCALVLLWLAMVRMYGERWVLVVPFVAVAFSPLTFALSTWWAYALQLLPVQLALFGAVQAHVSHLGSGRLWPAVRGMLFTAFGLAFVEKAVLIPFVLLGLTLAVTPGGLGARVPAVLRRHARLWLGYGVLLAAYVALHLWRAPVAGSGMPSPRQLASLVRAMIGDGLLPAVFGGPWNGDWVGLRGLAPPPTAVLALTWTLFAALVLIGLWLGRARAAYAWLTLAVYLTSSVLLVAAARLGPWGALIGTDPRYVADSLPVAVLCATLALLRPRVEGEDREPAGRFTRPDWARRVAGGGAAAVSLVLAAALAAGAAVSILGALPELRHQSTRDYVEHVAAAHELEPDLVLYDTPMPPESMLPLFGERAMASRALRGLGIRFDEITEDLRMLDPAGTPRKIGLVATVTDRPPPVPGCGYPVGRAATRIPLATRAEGPRLVVQLGYYTQLPTGGTVTTPTREFRVRFEAGLHVISLVADGPFAELLVTVDDAVCLTNVLVGLPLPRPN